MRLHAKLTGQQVHNALRQAKQAGHVTPDVTFTGWSEHRSQSRARAFEVHLGTYVKDSLPAGYTDQHGRKMNVRRFVNSGQHGAASGGHGDCGAVWAATWDEWGWFLACVFDADPDAVAGQYGSAADFNGKTKNAFTIRED